MPSRPRIVEEAAGMVHVTLQRLKDVDVIVLDQERTAAMQ